MSAAAMIKAMGEQIAYSRLPKEQLEQLSQGEGLSLEISQLGRVIAGLGCLVSSDGESQDRTRAGNFQSADDVSELLFCLGEMIEAKGELVCIANSARWHLGELNKASR